MKPEIYVNRFGEEKGPYSPEDIQDRLASGRLSSEDRYWHGGRADWTLLSEFDVAEAEASAEVRRTERGAEEAKKKLLVGVILGVIAIGITAFIFVRDGQEEDASGDDSLPPEEEQVEQAPPTKEADFPPQQ